jgi:dTDP-4-amino-4,6-dideoxygalactose transaminase
MIILKDSDFAAKLRLTKAFGVDRTHGERQVPGVYDVVELGFNYRMSEIHAAIGIAQVKKLPGFLSRRAENFQRLSRNLGGEPAIELLQSTTGTLQSSHYCLAVKLTSHLAAKRPQILTGMAERGVGASVYYPQPVPRMTYYARRFGWTHGSFPNAERLADSSISLSVGPHLGPQEMDHTAEIFKSVMKEVAA